MNKLNHWLTFGANAGVLAGIVILIFELQQNRQMIQAQTRNEVSVQIVDLLRDVSTSPQTASLINKATNGDELTNVETIQFQHRAAAMLRYFENVHYQYRQGLYDEVEFAAQEDAWRDFLKSGPYVSEWCRIRNTFSPDFRTAFDQLLSAFTC
jgi:hypothetical protein